MPTKPALEIRPVRSAAERRTFLTFPWKIYRKDPLWVPPLLPERRKTIDIQQGAFFQRGEAEFFIAWRGNQPQGTLCAANDRLTNEQRGMNDCMIGFFECVEEIQVAHALFDRAALWAKEHHLKQLYGPFNLDYEDSYGVLLEGRDRPPVMLCGHTPPYYRQFFESYGFQPARGANLAYAININQPSTELEKLSQLAIRARKGSKAVIRSARFDHWDEEIDAVLLLLNESLQHLPDFIPWQRSALAATLEVFREIANPELILFAEVDGKVVGFLPGLPNVNAWLIHANGLRYPWDYVSLWLHSHRRPDCLSIKSILVYPHYWGSSVVVLLLNEMFQRIRQSGYQWVDLSLTSDDNPRTPQLAERFGGQLYKKYMVYRKDLENREGDDPCPLITGQN